jgi:hypothetical protein
MFNDNDPHHNNIICKNDLMKRYYTNNDAFLASAYCSSSRGGPTACIPIDSGMEGQQ